MSMDGSAVKAIAELARVEVHTIQGCEFAPVQMHRIQPPIHDPLIVHTLQGIVDAIAAKFSIAVPDHSPPAIHVVDEETVRVLDPDVDEWGRYFIDIQAAIGNARSKFEFGRYYDTETFIIQLQTSFVDDETRAKLIRLASGISRSDEMELRDDGIQQTVAVKTGTHLLEKVEAPNPVTLRPYRTFVEVDQPPSPFVFRIKQGARGPECALFEADGGRWRLEAIASIAKWLKDKLPSWAIIA